MSKVLAIDPGGERLGWAVVEGTGESSFAPTLHGSGILINPRDEKEPWQEYKLRLIKRMVAQTNWLLTFNTFEAAVGEIIPATGSENYNRGTQGQLAGIASVSMYAILNDKGYEVSQIGATTVKKNIGGAKDATKVKVRNGVFELIPTTKVRFKEWTKIFDEPDAIAIGLAHLGYKVK